jgi:hypothetical protein
MPSKTLKIKNNTATLNIKYVCMILLLKETSASLLFISPEIFVRLAMSAFLAILFLQSGLDKVFQWQGNLDWLKGHFAKTFLRNTVPLMLGVVTVLEMGAGVCCGIGCVEILLWKTAYIALLGGFLAAAVLVMLFFGQRIAQDYAGAASLVPYFILSILGIILFDIKV